MLARTLEGVGATMLVVVASLLMAGSAASAQDAVEIPGRPSGLTVTAGAEALSYTATWTALDGATTYKVRWRLKGASFQAGNETTVETNRATFSVSEAGTWVVRLQACNAAGCGPGIARTVAITPSSAANLALSSSPGVLQISAAWEAASGASSYKVRWRRRDGGFAAGNEAVVTATSAALSVADYGWWVVRVEGCNAAGCSRGVNAATAIVPGPPANLVVSSTAGTLELTATWNATAGATSYRLRWRRLDGAFLAGNEAVVTTNSAAFSAPDYGRWAVRMEACHGSDCGPSTTRTVAIAPARPTNLAVSPTAGIYELAATWDAAAGATSYRLRWRRPDGAFLADNEINTTAASAALTVSGAGRWVIRLQGCSDDGCGGPATVRVTVPAPRAAVWTPVCDRTPRVRDELVAQTLKDCDEITPADLRWTSLMIIRNLRATTLKTGDFSGLPSLFTLDLEGNVLTSLPADLFEGLTDLAYLFLGNNALTAVPEDVFDGLTDLSHLYLDGNALTALPEDLFDGLSSLTDVGLAGNDLTELKEDLFDGLSNLKDVDLAGNALKALPADLFDDQADLLKLDLQGNDLASLPEDLFDDLSALQYLYLKGNALTALPADLFDDAGGLKYLYLGGNDLTALPEDVFDGTTALIHLHLNGNGLSALPEDVFDGLASLSALRLGGNALTAVPEDVFDGLSSLGTLLLEGNDLASLPEDVFDGLAQLWTLDVGDNAVTALPADVFDGLSRLRFLYLDDNGLAALPEGVFDDLTNLEALDLSGNPGAPFSLDLGSEVEVTQ